MNERLKIIRRHLNLSQDSFAKRLGVTGAAISRLEKGERGITGQMIKSICREFNINENWFVEGTGEMFIELSRSELVANIVGRLLANEDESIQSIFISLGKMTPKEWKMVKKIIDAIKDND